MFQKLLVFIGKTHFFRVIRLIQNIFAYLSISDFETENADADCCHLNGPETSLFSLMKLSELSEIIVANSTSDKVAARDTTKCKCCQLPLVCNEG